MIIDEQIITIPINQIEPIPWCVTRHKTANPIADQKSLLALAQSMLQPKRSKPPQKNAPAIGKPEPPRKTDNPSNVRDCSIGQQVPIKVIKHPPEMAFSKPYGLIFGNRRLQAAALVGITHLKAQVIHVTKQELDDLAVRFELRMMTYAENEQREPLNTWDRVALTADLEQLYKAAYPETTKKGPKPQQPTAQSTLTVEPEPKTPHTSKTSPQASSKASSTVASKASSSPKARLVASHPTESPKDPKPAKRFSQYLAEKTGMSESTIRYDLLLAHKLGPVALSLFQDNQLSPGAARQVVVIPLNRQTKVINAVLSSGLPLNERTIREAAARLPKDPTPESDAPPSAPPATSKNSKKTVVKLIPTRATSNPCDDCVRMLCEEEPLRCKHIQKISDLLQAATIMCSDLHLKFAWNDPLIQVLSSIVTKLSAASESLAYDLRHPDQFAKLNPSSMPHLVAPANGTKHHAAA